MERTLADRLRRGSDGDGGGAGEQGRGGDGPAVAPRLAAHRQYGEGRHWATTWNYNPHHDKYGVSFGDGTPEMRETSLQMAVATPSTDVPAWDLMSGTEVTKN